MEELVLAAPRFVELKSPASADPSAAGVRNPVKSRHATMDAAIGHSVSW